MKLADVLIGLVVCIIGGGLYALAVALRGQP